MKYSLHLLILPIAVLICWGFSSCFVSQGGHLDGLENAQGSGIFGDKNLSINVESLDPESFPGGGKRIVQGALLLGVSPKGEAVFEVRLDGRVDALVHRSRSGQFRPRGWMSKGMWKGSWRPGPDPGSATLFLTDGEQLSAGLPGFDVPSKGTGVLPAALEMNCRVLSVAGDAPDSLVEELRARARKSYVECSSRSFAGTDLEEIAPLGIIVLGSGEGVTMSVGATDRDRTIEILPPEVRELWRAESGFRGADWFAAK